MHVQEGYSGWLVCLSVSVKSHLTSGASVHPENTVTYSMGSGGQKNCGFYGVIYLPMASYSDIAAVFCATFRQQSFPKLLKRLTVI